MHRVFRVGIETSSGVISLATFVGLPLYAASGLLIRRFGSSLIFAGGIGCRCLCLSGLGYLFLYHPIGQRVSLFLLATAFQMFWPIISVSINDQVFRASTLGRGLSAGVLGSVGALASVAGALLSGFVADRVGYASVAAFAAFFSGLAFTLAIRIYRKSRDDDETSGAYPGGSREQQHKVMSIRGWKRTR